MNSNIEIFDKNGNKLDIDTVIVQYLKEQATILSNNAIAVDEESNGFDVDDILVGIDIIDGDVTTLMVYDQDFLTLDSVEVYI
jgi:hypothetical protein